MQASYWLQFEDVHGIRENVTWRCRYLPSMLTDVSGRYPQLVGVRFCLGVAEAGLFPGVVY